MAVYRVTFSGIHYNQITCQNVVAFRDQTNLMNPLTVAQELRDQWCTILAAGQTTQFGWRNISVRTIGSTASPFDLAIIVNGQDAADGSLAVPVITQKFRLHTAVAGKHGRGRIYLPGYRQSLWTGGQLNATGITNMTIRLNAITSRYVGPLMQSSLELGILRRGGTAADFIPVDFISLSLIPGVQRRRNLGVGI